MYFSDNTDEEEITANGDVSNELDIEDIGNIITLSNSAELKLLCLLTFFNEIYLFELLIRKTFVFRLYAFLMNFIFLDKGRVITF